MNVVNVPREVLLVTNGVLPEPPLPERIFPVRMALHECSYRDHVAAEISLDPAPAAGKICVALRQRENRVQMIRQDNDCVNREWAFAPGCAERLTQGANVIHEGG